MGSGALFHFTKSASQQGEVSLCDTEQPPRLEQTWLVLSSLPTVEHVLGIGGDHNIS